MTMYSKKRLAWVVTGFCLVLFRTPAIAQQHPPTVTRTTWREIEAFKLSDGRCEAIVVPKLGGRIVSFGLIGGMNFIWSGQPGSEKQLPALPWGGDKAYIGPQTMWKFTESKLWPPPAPDATEYAVETHADGSLTTVGTPWEHYGSARITRDYSFAANGDFIVSHTLSKVPDSHIPAAIWEIAQTVPTEAVFIPLNPVSPYKDHFFWFDYATPKDAKGVAVVSPTLLKFTPITGQGFKLGSHPKLPALATVKDGIAFVQRADAQEGDYPEGADGAGLSVELYHHDLPGPGEYVELEFLSPLRGLDQGSTLTTRWSVHTLPASWDASTIERLLGSKD